MNYGEYIQSNKPLWLSGVLLPIGMLLPVLVFVFEGWHDGMPWAIFIAILFAILIPGIYLIRPRVFWIWGGVTLVNSVFGIIIIRHYWLAEMPKAISTGIRLSCWFNLVAPVILGSCGWLRFVMLRKEKSQTSDGFRQSADGLPKS